MGKRAVRNEPNINFYTAGKNTKSLDTVSRQWPGSNCTISLMTAGKNAIPVDFINNFIRSTSSRMSSWKHAFARLMKVCKQSKSFPGGRAISLAASALLELVRNPAPAGKSTKIHHFSRVTSKTREKNFCVLFINKFFIWKRGDENSRKKMKIISADIINIRKIIQALIHLASSQILVFSRRKPKWSRQQRTQTAIRRVLPKRHLQTWNMQTAAKFIN